MGSLILPELSSNFRFSPKPCALRTIGEILPQRSHDVTEKIPRLEDYVGRLRDEMKKIDAFKRELPLCMLLLRRAIVSAEEELAQCRKSSLKPVLEEFIPLKKICKDEEVDEVKSVPDREDGRRDKMNWMSSVQLWNSTTHPSLDTDLISDKLTFKLEANKPSDENTSVVTPLVPSIGCTTTIEDRHEFSITALSLCTLEIKSPREGDNPIGFSSKSCSSRSGSPPSINLQLNSRTGHRQSGRKQRRCWSPFLQRRFINALQLLGGGEAATPKQIRELMRVDGLTNDEVKSHLQKYRLHSRKLLANPSSQSVDLWKPEEQCNKS